MGMHALDISDPSLLSSYTMIAHCVFIVTKVSDRRYDVVVKGQGHIHLIPLSYFDRWCSYSPK